MKALQITGYGKLSENLQFLECPLPEVQSNDVLIKVHAASINPIDYKTVKGSARIIRKLNFPASIGYDVSGVVEAVGESVAKFKLGDNVFARVESERPGTLAEYVLTSMETVAFKPELLSHEEAASVPLVGLTTLQAFKMAGLQKGQKVLIHAGSGGVGSFAVQLANQMGAEVYTTTSTKNVDWVKKLGVRRVFDYKKENYIDHLAEIDFVYDTIGGQHTKRAFSILKQGGTVINLTGPIIDRQSQSELGLSFLLRPVFFLLSLPIRKLIAQKKAMYRFFLMEPNGDQLQYIGNLMEQGKIRAVIDSVYPFNNAIEALLKLEKGHAKGKIVIKMN